MACRQRGCRPSIGWLVEGAMRRAQWCRAEHDLWSLTTAKQAHWTGATLGAGGHVYGGDIARLGGRV